MQHKPDSPPASAVDAPPDLAGFLARGAAFFIDFFLLSLLEAILLLGSRATAGSLVLVALGAAYFWFCWVDRNGQTLGNRVMRIRVIKSNGKALTTADALLRYAGYIINSLPFLFGIGWAWAVMDGKRQGWHDKLAGTIVINAPPVENPPA